MPVYVDDARIPRWGRRWSHMVADSSQELHDAARALGLGPTRAQDKGRTIHYDLPEEWRRRAIELGVARPITWRELAARRAEFPGAAG
jgi:signal recognition particle subunit SEC65